MSNQEIIDAVAETGLRARLLLPDADYPFFSIEGTWCQATLKWDHYEAVWIVRAKYVANRLRRWKNVYRGKVFATALKKLVELKSD